MFVVHQALMLLDLLTVALVFALTASAQTKTPHIFHVIVDDFGWGNTGYHRDTPTPEISTPVMDELVQEGIQLMRQYVHPECTPSRVSFQTGRLPMHSGQGNLCSPTTASCGNSIRLSYQSQIRLINEIMHVVW